MSPATAVVPGIQASREAKAPGYHSFAVFTAVSAFLLLIAGGLVTSTDSGLAVPTWPLANGEYFPRMVGGVLFEHGHRMVAGTVALLTFALTALVLREETRRWVRRVALAAAGGIVLQALLGGATVLLKLPPQVSIVHACLGQTLFCLLVLLADASSPWHIAAEGRGTGGLWTAGAAAAGLLFVQLALGAVVRHTGGHVEWHLLGAAAATFGAFWAAFLVFRGFGGEPALTAPAGALVALWPVQVLLGVGSFVIRRRPFAAAQLWRVAIPTAHVVCGALMLGSAVLLSARARRLQ